MKKGLLTICLATSFAMVNGQTLFQKAIDVPFMTTSAKNVVQTSDGGYLIGAAGSNGGEVMIKTDAQGNALWTKIYSTQTGTLALASVGECIGGGYYMFGSGSDSLYGTSYSITKTDIAGNVVWNKFFPTSAFNYGYPKCRTTADGGWMISQSNYNSMGALKLDANGNVTWSNSYSDDPNDQSPKCPSFNCHVNNDGSMIFEGKRNNDVLLVKTNPTGGMAWSSTIGNGISYYHAYGITSTSDGGYAVCGYANFIPFVMKVSSTGALLWYNEINTISSSGELDEIYETSNGNLVCIGNDVSNITFMTFNSTGTQVIATALPTQNSFYYTSTTMCPTSDGGYAFVIDYVDQQSGMTALSFFKTDASGTFLCGFVPYPVTFSTTQTVPTVLNVPIYSHTLAATSTAPAVSPVTLNVTETDFCVLFSTNDLSKPAEMSVYPSPVAAGDNISLEIKGAVASAIEIYNANGELVRNIDNSANSISSAQISTTDLSSGIYFVRVMDADHSLLGTTKFIIR